MELKSFKRFILHAVTPYSAFFVFSQQLPSHTSQTIPIHINTFEAFAKKNENFVPQMKF